MEIQDLTILLVEDNLLLAKTHSKMLQKNGARVIVANDPENAMKLFRTNENINIVLTDIDLGTEIDGTDLARIILTKRDIPLIFLSSRNDFETLKKTETITAYGYIEKNTGEAILIASIKLALRIYEAKSKLEESESLYRGFFNYYPSPLWIFEIESLNFLAVNKAAINKYGYTREEFLRMKISEIRPPEDIPPLLDVIKHTKPGLNKSGVWRHMKKNGEIFNVNIISHPLLWHGRKAKVVLALDADDTIEDQLIE